MILALGFCHKDYVITEKLFRWMAELDGKQHHTLILMVSKGLDRTKMLFARLAAEEAFHHVITLTPVMPEESGWPISANHLFVNTYRYVFREFKKPWQWIESDCVPLKKGWIDTMWSEYSTCGHPFMGCIYPMPFPHLTGCAIYPEDISVYNRHTVNPGNRAWDIAHPENTIRNAHHTELFQHVWGNFKHNIPPTFPHQGSLKLLSDKAVLFHRCKDGSLIDRLRERARHPKICKLLETLGPGGNGYERMEDIR